MCFIRPEEQTNARLENALLQFTFEHCVLDPERRELRRSGKQISVEPQVFDLLVYLIRNRDRVVSKDDLLAAIWNGRIVSESTLTTRINAARRAVNDNGKEQRLIRTVVSKGIRFVGAVREDALEPGGSTPRATQQQDDAAAHPLSPQQNVTFCKTPDGVNLAVAVVGEGTPLLKTANWLTHIEYDWQSPIWAPLLHRLAGKFRLIRYDGRGNGLSDWDVPEISFSTFEHDLETVVDALQLPRFALFGISQGAAVAISYAARFPERVSKLVLYGAYPLGRNQRGTQSDGEVAQAILTMMRQGWGDEQSAFMKAFSSLYLPEASPQQVKGFADMQRISASAENAVRIRIACDNINVLDLLPNVKAPTLVLHSRHDNVASFDQGRLVATTIPGARFVALESKNHVPVPDEAGWERMVAEIEAFLEE